MPELNLGLGARVGTGRGTGPRRSVEAIGVGNHDDQPMRVAIVHSADAQTDELAPERLGVA